jgi:hypothetical protein
MRRWSGSQALVRTGCQHQTRHLKHQNALPGEQFDPRARPFLFFTWGLTLPSPHAHNTQGCKTYAHTHTHTHTKARVLGQTEPGGRETEVLNVSEAQASVHNQVSDADYV